MPCGLGATEKHLVGVWHGYFNRPGGFPHHSYLLFRNDGTLLSCWLDNDEKKLVARLEGWTKDGQIHYHRSKYSSEYYVQGDHLYAKGDGWFKYGKVSELPSICL